MDRRNKLHIRDLVSGGGSCMTDRDSVHFFIVDEISDMVFVMKTVLNLMDMGCNTFYFLGKYKDIWYRTAEGMIRQSDAGCKFLKCCDGIDDAADDAAGFLNSGREVYLICDSQRLCAIVADKIREQEMHVSFHIGSLLNSME